MYYLNKKNVSEHRFREEKHNLNSDFEVSTSNWIGSTRNNSVWDHRAVVRPKGGRIYGFWVWEVDTVDKSKSGVEGAHFGFRSAEGESWAHTRTAEVWSSWPTSVHEKLLSTCCRGVSQGHVLPTTRTHQLTYQGSLTFRWNQPWGHFDKIQVHRHQNCIIQKWNPAWWVTWDGFRTAIKQ